jgi:peptide-methionine (R)-S-oxide reductase
MEAALVDRRWFLGAGVFGLAAMAWSTRRPAEAAASKFRVVHTDAEWRAMLQPAAYQVLRHEGTEPPFSSPLDHEERAGLYSCAGCDTKLYSSTTKYDSGTGWPSFWAPIEGGVVTATDNSLFMARTAVMCASCGGHLGHVFDDGPKPTGLRYCMNGVAMKFLPASA